MSSFPVDTNQKTELHTESHVESCESSEISRVHHPLSEDSINDDPLDDLSGMAASPSNVHGENLGHSNEHLEDSSLSDTNKHRRGSFSSCSLSDEKDVVSTNENPVEMADDLIFEVSITQPVVVGEGMSSYVSYSVNTRTNISEYKKMEFHVTRRFSDFLNMHEKLVAKYMRLGRFVPPLPEKSALGMAKVKLYKESNVSLDFIGKRKASLERYLNRIGRHPVLRIDPDFMEFIQSPDDYNKLSNNYSFNGVSFRRILNAVSNSVSKLSFKFDEPDDWNRLLLNFCAFGIEEFPDDDVQWFEENQQLIDGLYAWCKKLSFGLNKLSSLRKDSVQIIADFHRSLLLLSSAEENISLSHMLTYLTDGLEELKKEYNQLSENDFFILTELAKDYVFLLEVVKDVFGERYRIFSSWQSAEETLKKKKELRDKYESSAKRDKVPQADLEILELIIV